ncbi:MAG: serine/threonine protein kinase [Acidobacteriota bacterium]
MAQHAARALSVPLLARVVLALVAVGLLPFAISAYQLSTSRTAIVQQAQLTHKTAARAMADRVAAYLELLRAIGTSAAQNPNLYRDPASKAAEEVLKGLLEARAELIAAGIFLEGAAQQPLLVQLARVPDRETEIEGALAHFDARDLVATRQPGAEDVVAGRLWLRLRTPIERAPLVRADDELNLILIVDVSTLIRNFMPTELGAEADLALVDRSGEVLSGNVATLDGFPNEFLDIAAAGQLSSAAGEYPVAGGEPVIAAYADVPGIAWFAASKQPSRIAETAATQLRAVAWRAFGGAMLLTLLLSWGAEASIVRPIRRLVRSQRELVGGPETSGDEIAQLESAFAALEQNLHDRDALSEVFLDRYQVVGVLGSGAMGTVFRGWDPKLQREVALKTLRIGAELSPVDRHELTAKLVQEAVTLARLQHAHIVTVFDVVHQGEAAFIAMELVDGIGLDVYLHQQTRMPLDQVVTLGMALFDALAVAHEAGFVHHDLKPANVLLGASGAIKITDFGVSELLTTAYQRQGDFVCGTPGYLAPEVLIGEPYTVAADLFAVGVILYQCAVGYRPFKGSSVKETLVQTVSTPAISPRVSCPEISTELEELILTLLDKKPENRPADAASVARVLTEMANRRGWSWSPRPLAVRDTREVWNEEAWKQRDTHLSVLPTSTVYR